MKYILFDSSGQLIARYDSALHGKNIPAGAISVNDDLFLASIQDKSSVFSLNAEKQIVKTAAVDLSSEIAANDERTWRNNELFRSDIELNKVQDSDPKATGSVSDWRGYRKALRDWPDSNNFPNNEFRPKAPDAK